MEYSSGRVTTALSVHGTTVIHQGRQVNEKAQHQQVKLDRRQTLTEFIKERQVNLKRGERYSLSDMAVTSDNKLLLCNYDLSHPADDMS
jgi:hypothetical protein